MLYNGSIIVGGLVFQSVAGFAWGALVGAVLGGWLFPVYDLRRVTRLGFRIAPLHPSFRLYLWGALPLMIGLSLTTVDEWYERFFGARLGVGVVATTPTPRRAPKKRSYHSSTVVSESPIINGNAPQR